MFRTRVLPFLLLFLAAAGVLMVLGFRDPPDPSPQTAPASDQTADPDDWRLVLVNAQHPIQAGNQPELAHLDNGLSLDQRCVPALNAMLEACRASGLSPVVCSAYRTWEKQERLFHTQVDKLLTQGYSQEDARREAARYVAAPGTSEHQLGLAADIVDQSYQSLDANQADTPVQQWLMAHCWEYGFILRYPPEKSDRTGVIYEPWHYRYVGRDAAEAITHQGICLEEYLAP